MPWNFREKVILAVALAAFVLVVAVAAIKDPPKAPSVPDPHASISVSISPASTVDPARP